MIGESWHGRRLWASRFCQKRLRLLIGKPERPKTLQSPAPISNISLDRVVLLCLFYSFASPSAAGLVNFVKILTKFWQNVDKSLTKCWQHFDNILTKLIYLFRVPISYVDLLLPNDLYIYDPSPKHRSIFLFFSWCFGNFGSKFLILGSIPSNFGRQSRFLHVKLCILAAGHVCRLKIWSTNVKNTKNRSQLWAEICLGDGSYIAIYS